MFALAIATKNTTEVSLPLACLALEGLWLEDTGYTMQGGRPWHLVPSRL